MLSVIVCVEGDCELRHKWIKFLARNAGDQDGCETMCLMAQAYFHRQKSTALTGTG
jgi:hypothetical protein